MLDFTLTGEKVKRLDIVPHQSDTHSEGSHPPPPPGSTAGFPDAGLRALSLDVVCLGPIAEKSAQQKIV
jgi:hypothetical protein